MGFARKVFAIAGIYGVLVMAPQFFLEAKTGRDFPPEINHPEFYYGFVGTAFAFQFVFLAVARDPARHRPLMIPSMIEKAGFGIAAPVLYLQHRIPGVVAGFGLIDLLLLLLFAASYVKTRPSGSASST